LFILAIQLDYNLINYRGLHRVGGELLQNFHLLLSSRLNPEDLSNSCRLRRYHYEEFSEENV